MTQLFEKHITIKTSDTTALDCLSEHTGFSKQKLKQVMQNGAVWLESRHGILRIRRAKKILAPGDILHLYYSEKIQSEIPAPAILVADEDGYSIWKKPAGMFSQGSKWGDHCSIYRWSETHLQPQRPAFLVHRLDKAARGLIILAHKKSVATDFLNLFKQQKINKKYLANVSGIFEPASLPFPIDTPLDNKKSFSEIISVIPDEKHNQTRLEVRIKTGRKHQIRRHLAGLGYPILGDRLYGDAQDKQDLQLQSCYLAFTCPVNKSQKEYQI